MKRISLALIIMVILGCVMPLSAQDEGGTTYFAYVQYIKDGYLEIRARSIVTDEDMLLVPLPREIPSGARFSEIIPSPDGTRLLLRYHFEENGTRNVELQWVELATQQVTTIHQTEKRVFDPRWSPDSTHISFRTSNGDYSSDNFWIYDLASASLTNPLSAPSEMYGYNWSPDGQTMVIYVAERNVEVKDDLSCERCPTHLDLVDIASGERTLLLDDSDWAVDPPRSFRDVLCSFRWSPDQKTIAIVLGCVTAYVPGYADLYLLDLASKTATPIVTSKDITGQADKVEAYVSPVWVDNNTLWVGYFMKASTDAGSDLKAGTRLYDLSTSGKFESIHTSALRLVALQNGIAVANSMDDFIATVGTLNGTEWTVTDVLQNVCDEYVSPHKQFVAYENCDYSNSVTLINLQTADIQQVSLPDNAAVIGWVSVPQHP